MEMKDINQILPVLSISFINHFKKITSNDHPFVHLKKVGMADRNIVYIKFYCRILVLLF